MAGPAGPWTYLAPVLILGMVILRNARARKLRIERLWIAPAILLSMGALVFAISPPPSPTGIAIDVAALVLGAGLGWWRARASAFTINPETHEITSKVSAWGMLLILAIFALRYAVRTFAADQASVLHVSALELADSFLVLAVGLVCAQRLEWLVRARRMLAAARAGLADAP
jgi:membrane protein CcdC involved in cytochrome C biogenesis